MFPLMKRKISSFLAAFLISASIGIMAQGVSPITVPTTTGDTIRLDLTPKVETVSLKNIDEAYDNKDYEQAISVGESIRNFWEEVYGKEHPKVIDLLQKLADSYFQTKQYKKAIEVEDSVYHRLDYEGNYTNESYLNSISNLAKYYNATGDSINGMRFATEAVSKWGTIESSTTGYVGGYMSSLSTNGSYYAKYGNYRDAIAYEVRASQYIGKKLGKKNLVYGNSLRIISEYEGNWGCYEEAIAYGKEAAKLLENHALLYGLMLYDLAFYYKRFGDYDEVVKCAEGAVESLASTGNRTLYGLALICLAETYRDIKSWPMAVRYWHKAIEVCDEEPNINPAIHYSAYNQLVMAYSSQGDYINARRYAMEVLDYAKRSFGTEHELYANALNNVAAYSMLMGYTDEAVVYEKKAVEVMKISKGRGSALHIGELFNLSDLYRGSGDYQSMKDVASEAVQLARDSLGTESLWYTRALSSLAKAEYHTGKIDEAIRYGEMARQGTLENEGKENLFYSNCLWNLSTFYFSIDSITKAIPLATEAMDISTRVDSIQGVAFMIEKDLLTFYSNLEDNEKVDKCVVDITDWISETIVGTFLSSTAHERNAFWNKHKNWFEIDIHRYAYRMPSEILSSVGYNGTLLSKGLLLNSDIEFSRLVAESGDSTVIRDYNKLLRTKASISVLQAQEQRYLSVDSLRKISEELEISLLASCKALGNYTENLSITWERVQENLTGKDLAVEFVSFPVDSDSTVYLAYVIRKGWKCPKTIPLFEEQKLKEIPADDYYKTDRISRIVWEPLSNELRGVNTVYFAASGELYNIAIEHVPDYATNGSALVSDSRTFYRLSSTRELALKRDRDNWKDAAVYGGLTYGMNAASIINNSRNFFYDKANLISISDDYYDIADTLTRAGITASKLEGTRNEAKAIVKALRRYGIDTTLYMDTIGTEASFKKLSGKKKSIMHVGTHGFFWTEPEAKKFDYDFLLHNDQYNRYVEDKQLTRSGLLFAGANYSLSANREKLPEDVDDGILTAKEITSVDLRGLDLVVLSACQTGLGEITGDGVFGLQRGFKKAGAHTIIMSLWKVHDKATEFFITKFFEKIKVDRNGYPVNKHEAFLAAQDYLRTGKAVVEIPPTEDALKDAAAHHERTPATRRITFDDPKFWAAFIMLDGLR